VELMGGKITVNSKKNKGSTFSFTINCELVLNPVNLKPQETKEQSVDSLPFVFNKHVLIVEDNLVNQRVLQRHLEDVGFTCQMANNGLEAVKKMEQMQFDIVFMDIEMPVMNGLDATQQIRSQDKNKTVPIIGLSANARQEHIDEAINSGMNDYIIKPYNKEILLRSIKKFLF